jgi:predicted dehydrogenase
MNHMQIAVAGLGFMGSVHARALSGRLAGVCSQNPAHLAGELGGGGNLGDPISHLDFSGVKKYSDFALLLADPEIDAVDLCLPTHLHESAAIAALRAGKHVLVEKPIALDAASARRMIDAARTAGRVLMCAQVLRFLPEYVALRDALGRLGPGRRAWFHRRCAEPSWGGWLKEPALSGGAVFDLLIHDADFCLHLFGAPSAVSATGDAHSLHAELFYPGGMVAVITGGWEAAPSYQFRMEYSVTAEGGTVEFSSLGRVPTLYAAEVQPLPLTAADGYAAEIDYFLKCCAASRAPDLCPPLQSAQAVDLMRLLEHARIRQGEKLPCNL